MAKTKKTAKVAAELRRELPPPTEPSVEPPKKRVNGKSSASSTASVPPNPMAERWAKLNKPKTPQPSCETSWENFNEIMDHYGMTEHETTTVLYSLLGPDPKGCSFWKKYQDRARAEGDLLKDAEKLVRETVKAEVEEPVPPESAPPVEPPAPAPEPESKKPRTGQRKHSVLKGCEARALKANPPDNQLGDPTLYPELHPECFNTVVDPDMEEMEEEPLTEDEELNEETVAAKGGGSDDQDSPQGGAATAPVEAPDMVVEPSAPVEPVRVSVCGEDAATQAKDDLKKALAIPTPARQGRSIVQATRVERSPEPRRLKSKIDAIISRSKPRPDPDCPDDPESVRFWATAGGHVNETERSKVTATAHASIVTTPTGLAGMMGDAEFSGGVGNTSQGANGPSLRALVDVANAPVDAPAAKAKAKTKAKAKAKAVAQQTPKTPAEQRTAIRPLVCEILG
eukprot:Skav215126  [mRNA]  locus=scaffold1164:7656:10297:+ [translate_table: standard]